MRVAVFKEKAKAKIVHKRTKQEEAPRGFGEHQRWEWRRSETQWGAFRAGRTEVGGVR